MALRNGFSNASHLTRQLRRRMGTTPAAYRGLRAAEPCAQRRHGMRPLAEAAPSQRNDVLVNDELVAMDDEAVPVGNDVPGGG